jgi:hypothetical protein
MKTDINDFYLETTNDNIKSVLPNKNFFDNKLKMIKDIFSTPYGLLRKNNDLQ